MLRNKLEKYKRQASSQQSDVHGRASASNAAVFALHAFKWERSPFQKYFIESRTFYKFDQTRTVWVSDKVTIFCVSNKISGAYYDRRSERELETR